MPTVIHGSLTSERKASTSPSSFINRSTLLLNRALKRQAPCLYMHFEVRAITRPCCSIERSSAKLLVFTIDRLRTHRRIGSTRRRGNHMHDHSRFQRDINDVTGVSLSLSLSLYLSQKSLTHNIGSASALPIIKLAVSLCSFLQLSFPFNFQTANALVLKFGTLPLRCFFSNTLLAIFDIFFCSKVIHRFVPKMGQKWHAGVFFNITLFQKRI